MDRQIELVLDYYGEKLERDLKTKEFALGFFPNSENFCDRISAEENTLSSNGRTLSFLQDFSYGNKIMLSDYNICYVDDLIFIKIITPFLLDRSYDFIVAEKSKFKEVISKLKQKQSQREKNNKIKSPLIGIDFDNLKKETIDFLLDEELRKFCNSKFIKLKRGIVFEGPPGQGKSTALTWLKVQAKLNNIDFQSFSDPKNFLENRDRFFNGSKMIFAFEDFDAFLRDRNDTDNSPNSILSIILNTLDGIDEIENVVTIFTTNRINTFDSAFIRPGRIDKVIKFDLPKDENIFQFFEAYLPEYSTKEYSIIFENLKGHNTNISYALLKGICDDINIAVFNNERKNISIENIIKILEEKIKSANKNEAAKRLESFIL